MADSSKVIDIIINTKTLTADARRAYLALRGLDLVLSSIAEGVKDAFSVKGYSDYKDAVSRFGKELADALLVLQLSFGKMKYAIAEAVAPIASVFVPMLNTAIAAVIRFAGVVGQFLRGILAGITGNQNLAQAAREAVKSEQKLGSAARAAGKAARKSLAGFDQLERLNQPAGSGSGGGGGSADLWGGYTQDPISPQVQAVVDKVLAILAPLMAIQLQPLQLALQTLGASFSRLAAVAGEALSFLWYEILTPFAAWILEVLAPVLTEGWAAKLDLITAAMIPLTEGIRILWEALQPVVAYIGEQVIRALEDWQRHFEVLTQVLQEKQPVITGIFKNIAQIVTQLWSVAAPVLTAFGNHFSSVFGAVSHTVGTALGYVLDMLYGLSSYLSGAFSGNWEKAWDGMRLFLKSAVNGVISLLNSMISRMVSALNAVVRTANKLSFTVPEWVPSLGGRRFGVNLPTVSAPKIPYLARGAVLPAGKPFLAVVGDQRHGTNIEAPLATIQEAVAQVMGDQVSAMMAGFEALLEENQRLRRVVEGIELGDTVIGQAAVRYNQKMAVIRGG